MNVIPFPGRVPMWTFAERARKVRRELGYNQAQMAAALNVGEKAYAAWESGKNNPADLNDIATRFEQASGVSRLWFIGWAEGSPTGPGISEKSRTGNLHAVSFLADRRRKVAA